MMFKDLLNTFQRFTGPLAIAEALRAAGATDLVDVALLEWFLFKPQLETKDIVAWVEAWPMLGRWGKPTIAAGDVTSRVNRLVEVGLLQRTQGYVLTTRALECFPIVLPRGERPLDVAVDVSEVCKRLRSLKKPANALAVSMIRLIDPADEASMGEVAADFSGLHATSAVIAEALLHAFTSDPVSLTELREVLDALRSYLTHPARQSGPTPGSVVRWAVLRFADNVAPMFNPGWLGDDTTPRNDVRCEWLLRSFAAYVGMGVRQGAFQETALDSVRQLLVVDHRRAKLFSDEAEYQTKVVDIAGQRLKAEQVRRAEAAKAAAELAEKQRQDPSYAGGRRE